MQRCTVPTTAPDRTRLTVGIMITVAVLAFEALAVATIGPRIAHDLGGDDLYGWLFSAFMLANLVGIVLAGHESDRRGPAVVYVVGLGCFGAGLVLGGLAPSMLVLVAARAVQGLGAGALYNAAYVAVGRAFSETERPRVFALLSSAWVVPGLIAPALGGVVAELFGWRWVFLGMIVLVPLAAVLALPPMRALGAGRPDDATPPLAAAVLLAGGAALLLAGLGVASVWITPPFVVVGAVLAITQIRRLTPPGTLRARRGLPAAVAFRGLSTFSFFGADAFLAFALARLHGLDPIAVGLVITPATLTWTAASWVQARLAGRRSRRALATAGAVCIAVGIAMASAVVIEDVSLAVIVVAWAIGGFGMGLSYSPTSLVALSEAAPGRQGAATSSVQLTDVLGAALGTGVAGAIVAAAASLDLSRRDALAVVFALMALVALVGILVARRFPRTLPSWGPRPTSCWPTATAPQPPHLRSRNDRLPGRVPLGHRDRGAPGRGRQREQRLVGVGARARHPVRGAVGRRVDHFWRYPEDLDISRDLGFGAYRFSLEWSRIEPEAGEFSAPRSTTTPHVIDACHARDLLPVVTFHHFTTPRWAAADGGWANPAIVDRFTRFMRGRGPPRSGRRSASRAPSTSPTSWAHGLPLGPVPARRHQRPRRLRGRERPRSSPLTARAVPVLRASGDFPVGLTALDERLVGRARRRGPDRRVPRSPRGRVPARDRGRRLRRRPGVLAHPGRRGGRASAPSPASRCCRWATSTGPRRSRRRSATRSR